MNIVVHSIHPVNDQGNLRAFADVTMDGDRSPRWRIIQQSGQRAWVSPPQITYDSRVTGETIYRPAISITKEQRLEVQAAVLAVWQEEGANE